MLTKILLTLLVIVIAFLVVRNRSASAPATAARSGQPAAAPIDLRRAWLIGGVVALLLVVSLGSILYRNWRYDQELVSVRVVDIRSGQAELYRARRAKVQGRSFVTLDGRTVTVADSERVEVIEGGPEGNDIRLP